MASENLDLFSLEDDEFSELFITQEPSVNNHEDEDKDQESIEMDNNFQFGKASNDFSSPCVSLVRRNMPELPHYSDISDDENVFEKSMDIDSVRSVQLLIL